MSELEALAADIAQHLGNPDSAVSAASFPRDRDEAAHSGMYAWWADTAGVETVSDVLACPPVPLLYAGQAGATSTRSNKPSNATLLSRVRGQHIRGNIYGSTMRRTFAAVLRDPLKLAWVDPKRLADDGEVRLRDWIEQHLSVAIAPVGDPAALAHVEPLVLRLLDPPLNLDHVEGTESRRRLRTLRSQAGRQ